WHLVRFRRLLAFAWPAPLVIQRQASELAERLGLKRAPVVWLVPGTVSPMVWGVGTAARLLFPVKLLERLEVEQRAALLAHELAHLRRRDQWVRVFELV